MKKKKSRVLGAVNRETGRTSRTDSPPGGRGVLIYRLGNVGGQQQSEVEEEWINIDAFSRPGDENTHETTPINIIIIFVSTWPRGGIECVGT